MTSWKSKKRSFNNGAKLYRLLQFGELQQPIFCVYLHYLSNSYVILRVNPEESYCGTIFNTGERFFASLRMTGVRKE